MLTGLITGLKIEAQATMRRLSYAMGGMIFCLIGFGFLSAAGWMLLAEWRDALFATLVVGAVYFGLGLIFLGLSRRAYRAKDLRIAAEAGAAAQSDAPKRAALPPMAEAFMTGLNAGMRR